MTRRTRHTSMPKRPLTRRDTDALRDVREKLTFKSASFSRLFSEGDPLPKTEAEVDEFIRRRTKLFIESWIMPTLDELISRGDKDEE